MENKRWTEKQFNEDWNYVVSGENGYYRRELSDTQFADDVLIGKLETTERVINPTIKADVMRLKNKWRDAGFAREVDMIFNDDEGESFYQSLFNDEKKMIDIRLENPTFYDRKSLSVMDLTRALFEINQARPSVNCRIVNLDVSDVIAERTDTD